MKSFKSQISNFSEKSGGTLEDPKFKIQNSKFPLRQWTGPLTADLVRTPGAFGLGQVPARLVPD